MDFESPYICYVSGIAVARVYIMDSTGFWIKRKIDWDLPMINFDRDDGDDTNSFNSI